MADHQRTDGLEGFPTRQAPEVSEVESRRWVFRHPVVIRITHWVNVLCLAILLMSGLQIFNAHPALYWGQISTFDHPLVSMDATDTDPSRGRTTVLGHSFDTTGLLGLSSYQGQPSERAFPSWITLPAGQDLATGRHWHFLFAWAFFLNGLIYLVYGLASGQLRFRVIPSRDQLHDIGGAIREHLTLRFARGEEAKRYNVIQKLTYLVVLVLLVLQVLAGLAMSPGLDAFAPPLLAFFGGRQSARTVHFVIANLLVLFVIVHVAMVILSGFANNMRGMLTGWFTIERRRRQPVRKTASSGDAA